jgi:uncharacterized GH25 family protein
MPVAQRRTIMRKILNCSVLIIIIILGSMTFAHHQIAYLAPYSSGFVAFISSGHHLPMGESFSGLESYKETVIIDPAGKKNALNSATDMCAFGLSVMPFTEKGLYILAISSEHYGNKTTTGYFSGTKKEAIQAGKKVLESKHTFRYSKSYRWNGNGPEPALRVGHLIEIVPDKIPIKLKKGDKIPVTVYLMDKPATKMIIGVSSMKQGGEIAHPEETDKFLSILKTDKNGKAELEMLDSGWMVFMVENLTENPEPDVDKLYHSTTLTLWVEE